MSDTDRLEYLIATHDTVRQRGDWWIVDDALASFTPVSFRSAREAIDDAILNRWPTHWRNKQQKGTPYPMGRHDCGKGDTL